MFRNEGISGLYRPLIYRFPCNSPICSRRWKSLSSKKYQIKDSNDKKDLNIERKKKSKKSLGTINRSSLNTTPFTFGHSNIKSRLVRPITDDGKKSILDYTQLPRLRDSLEKVLYEPVVLHPLQDERTKVFNYDHTLETVNSALPPASSLHGFTSPKKDDVLINTATHFNKKYISSTSSMTAVLSQLHFLLSNFRQLNLINYNYSKNRTHSTSRCFRSAKAPASIIISKIKKKRNNKSEIIKSIDSDPLLNKDMILSALGHTLEEFLTRGGNKSTNFDPNSKFYHYTTIDNFLIRSQLDCFDPNLPDHGVFDLKTRAVSAIRYDLPYVEKNQNYTGYEINQLHGQFESMDREFHDMIKGPLLKYSLQARMGAMDGIFIAYHNINRIFGFQYLPLEEIDYILHSVSDQKFKNMLKLKENMISGILGKYEHVLKHDYKERHISSLVADAEFKLSIQVFGKILEVIENKYFIKNIEWEKLRISMKAVYSNKSPPKLVVICVPIDQQLEEESVLSPLKNCTNLQETIAGLNNIRYQQEQLITTKIENSLGLEINIENILKRHSSSLKYTHLLLESNKDSLSSKDRAYLNKKLNINFYGNSNKWSHPNFLDASDVQTWDIKGFIKESNKDKIIKSYMEMIEEKLGMLERDLSKEFLDEESESNSSTKSKQRLGKYIQNERILDAMAVEERDMFHNEYNDFHLILRAYADKGGVNRNRKEKIKYKY